MKNRLEDLKDAEAKVDYSHIFSLSGVRIIALCPTARTSRRKGRGTGAPWIFVLLEYDDPLLFACQRLQEMQQRLDDLKDAEAKVRDIHPHA